MDDDKTRLILGVEKPIWLAATGPMEKSGTEIIGWTTTKPAYDNGFIDKGSVLIFVELSSQKDTKGRYALEFMIIYVGPVPGEYPADFYEEEIDSLTKEGALTLLRTEDIDEMSIVTGEVFIKYSRHSSFDAQVFSPRDIYIIIGPEQMKQSNAEIVTGEKISLRHLLEVYSRAVGQKLIPK